jgi:hypothetical protein
VRLRGQPEVHSKALYSDICRLDFWCSWILKSMSIESRPAKAAVLREFMADDLSQ